MYCLYAYDFYDDLNLIEERCDLAITNISLPNSPIKRGEQAYNINNPHQNHVDFLYVNVAFNVNDVYRGVALLFAMRR